MLNEELGLKNSNKDVLKYETQGQSGCSSGAQGEAASFPESEKSGTDEIIDFIMEKI